MMAVSMAMTAVWRASARGVLATKMPFQPISAVARLSSTPHFAARQQQEDGFQIEEPPHIRLRRTATEADFIESQKQMEREHEYYLDQAKTGRVSKRTRVNYTTLLIAIIISFCRVGHDHH
tara:strand:+ start:4187 stop:4549 length:363 start_codon:yes stop_codon:yes gene_type:complete